MRTGTAIPKEYQQLSAAEQRTYRRWIVANTVVGALAFLILISVTAFHSSIDGSETAQKGELPQHASAH
jgi:uncharacterized membrane protein YdjX (TVP38/TMEM64 family)